jgi:HEAT repeat protein
MHLLGIAAEAVLKQIAANGPEMGQRVAALEALATTGDKSAEDMLARLGQSAGVEGQVALAKLGDPAAADALAKKLAANPRDSDMIQRLGGVKARAVEDELIHVLADADPGTRAAAADALARSGSENAAEPLLKALKDPEASVQQSAAVALAAIGRPEGNELVDRMLQSGVPDIVLSVAEALPMDAGRWQAVVQPLLDTENPVDRLRAARLMGNNSPVDANRVLAAALSDENVAVREEAARSLSDVRKTEGSTDWRRLLSDPSAWVRLEAARAIWRQVTE